MSCCWTMPATGDIRSALSPTTIDLISGWSAGISGLIVGHPFDTIKTRLQTQAPNPANATPTPSTPHSTLSKHAPKAEPPRAFPRYTSSIDAGKRMFQAEGPGGFYKGMTPPALGIAAMNASIFGVYGWSLRALQGHDGYGLPVRQSSASAIFLAGCASGIATSLITAPIELVKIRMQMTYATMFEVSTLDNVRILWKQAGLRSVYRGLGCTAVRDLGYGPYFLSYELMNRGFASLQDRPEASSVEKAVSGGLAGVLAWMSTFPIDVVKTRVQMTDRRKGERGTAFWPVAREIYREAGWRAFVAGIGPTLLRALPVNAVLFYTYEQMKDALTLDEQNRQML